MNIEAEIESVAHHAPVLVCAVPAPRVVENRQDIDFERNSERGAPDRPAEADADHLARRVPGLEDSALEMRRAA